MYFQLPRMKNYKDVHNTIYSTLTMRISLFKIFYAHSRKAFFCRSVLHGTNSSFIKQIHSGNKKKRISLHKRENARQKYSICSLHGKRTALWSLLIRQKWLDSHAPYALHSIRKSVFCSLEQYSLLSRDGKYRNRLNLSLVQIQIAEMKSIYVHSIVTKGQIFRGKPSGAVDNRIFFIIWISYRLNNTFIHKYGEQRKNA